MKQKMAKTGKVWVMGVAALTFGGLLFAGNATTANAATAPSTSASKGSKTQSNVINGSDGSVAVQTKLSNGDTLTKYYASKTDYQQNKKPITQEVTASDGTLSTVYDGNVKLDSNGQPTDHSKSTETIINGKNGSVGVRTDLDNGKTLTSYYNSLTDQVNGAQPNTQEVVSKDSYGNKVSTVYAGDVQLSKAGQPVDSSVKPLETINTDPSGAIGVTTILANGGTLTKFFNSLNDQLTGKTPTKLLTTINGRTQYYDGNVKLDKNGQPVDNSKPSNNSTGSNGSNGSNSSTGSTTTTPAASSSSTTSSSSSSTPSSSSSSSSSTTSSATTNNNSSAETVNSNLKNYYVSLKSSHLFAKKGLYEYKGTHFNKSRRFKYVPAGTVLKATKVQSTANGKSEIKLSDGKYITGSKSFTTTAKFKKGYQTTPTKYAYVKSAKGVNEYNKAAFGKAKKTSHAKKGVFLKVRRLVKSGSTTRYQLTNGHYVTGAKSAVVGTNKR